jgi:hypothetical protein
MLDTNVSVTHVIQVLKENQAVADTVVLLVVFKA